MNKFGLRDAGHSFPLLELAVNKVYAPAFGRPQLVDLLTAKYLSGPTILMAAVSTESIPTFEAVVKAAKDVFDVFVAEYCSKEYPSLDRLQVCALAALS